VRVLAYPRFRLGDQEIRAPVEEELLAFVDTVRVRRRLAVVRPRVAGERYITTELFPQRGAAAVKGNAAADRRR
jgi:hypothetical protein